MGSSPFGGIMARRHFNVGEMKKMLIPVPSLDEQKKIVTILSTIDSKISENEFKKSNLQLTKKGLMQKLLTGQIRVKV